MENKQEKIKFSEKFHIKSQQVWLSQNTGGMENLYKNMLCYDQTKP